MNDFFDEFDGDNNGDEYDGNGDNNFLDEDFGDDDFFENEFVDDKDDMDDLCDDDLAAADEELVDTESDEFTVKDAFILGGAMGWAYEEGFQDAFHQRRQKKVKELEKLSSKKCEKDGIRGDNEKLDDNCF